MGHPADDTALGGDYVDLCRRSSQPLSSEDVVGVQAVLAGSRASYAAEQGVMTPAGERWYAVSVVPLNRPDGGAVVSHTDITERRQAEVEAHRSREELAHFLRVSTMGELTTSLAHELNQPLTAILANAQAVGALILGSLFAFPLLPLILERLRTPHADRPHPELPARLDTRSVHAIPIPLLAAAFVLSIAILVGSTLNPFL